MQGLKEYSPSEISGHTSKKDCWLIIHGKVYDVTSFLEEHPGGEDVLLQAAANGDATQSFEDVGHSSTAASMMEGYLIGVTEARESPAGHSKSQVQAVRAGYSDSAKMEQERKLTATSTNFKGILLPLLMLALAFGAWYFLTYFNLKA